MKGHVMNADSFCATVSAPEYKKHPHGTFECRIDSLAKKQYPTSGRNYISISSSTHHGKAPEFTVNLISDADVAKASSDPDHRKKCISMVEMFKGTLVKMGLCSAEEASAMDQTKMIACIASSKGRMFMVTVLSDKNDPKYDRCFLDAYDHSRITDHAPANQKPQVEGFKPSYASEPVQSQPQSMISIDDVPF